MILCSPMKPSDYHRWWMASGIGLGHPLKDDNFDDIRYHLSRAGCCVVTLLHTILANEGPTSKNYFIGDTEVP